MANFYEYGSTKAAVLDVDMKRRTVKGMFASFDTIDDGNDVFRRGAFTKTIMENGPSSAEPRIKHLYNHWDAIGVIQDLKETNIGLEYVCGPIVTGKQIGRASCRERVLRLV